MCGEQTALSLDMRVEGGITPACAGNSWTLPGSIDRSRDHPRVCGEQDLGYSVPIPGGGSTPRLPGRDCNSVKGRKKIRITPACAGNRPFPINKGRPR